MRSVFSWVVIGLMVCAIGCNPAETKKPDDKKPAAEAPADGDAADKAASDKKAE